MKKPFRLKERNNSDASTSSAQYFNAIEYEDDGNDSNALAMTPLSPTSIPEEDYPDHDNTCSNVHNKNNSSANDNDENDDIYKLTDTASGKVYDIRELEKNGSDDACFHTRKGLLTKLKKASKSGKGKEKQSDATSGSGISISSGGVDKAPKDNKSDASSSQGGEIATTEGFALFPSKNEYMSARSLHENDLSDDKKFSPLKLKGTRDAMAKFKRSFSVGKKDKECKDDADDRDGSHNGEVGMNINHVLDDSRSDADDLSSLDASVSEQDYGGLENEDNLLLPDSSDTSRHIEQNKNTKQKSKTSPSSWWDKTAAGNNGTGSSGETETNTAAGIDADVDIANSSMSSAITGDGDGDGDGSQDSNDNDNDAKAMPIAPIDQPSPSTASSTPTSQRKTHPTQSGHSPMQNYQKRRKRKVKPAPILQPKNTLPVRCIHKSKSASDFNPLLLISTLTKAHDGPIWSTALSKGFVDSTTGRKTHYLATGGADGVVQIWELAPSRETLEKQAAANAEDGVSVILSSLESMWKGIVGSVVNCNANCNPTINSTGTMNASTEDENSTHSNKSRPRKRLGTDRSSSSQSSQKTTPLAPPLATVNSKCDALGTDICLINPIPVQRFTAHEEDVVDLSWSSTNFLISASLDKTARLWHPSRPMCLKEFNHADAVTSVSFHPSEDRYFVSGGFDKKLRIWHIPNGRVAEWAQASNVITAATYQPDGKVIAAGLCDGKVIFYSLDGSNTKMKYFTQITCKNGNGGKKNGKKVTGLTYLPQLSEDKLADGNILGHGISDSEGRSNEKQTHRTTILAAKKAVKMVKSLTSSKKKQVKEQLLITTNDSRMRLVGMNDFCMVRKFKGHLNACYQIKAKFSESGDFIVSGSESRTCNIWNTATKRNPLNVNVTGLHMYDKVKGYECFEATKADPPVVTDSTFAPGQAVESAFLSSRLFPTLQNLSHIDHDFSSAVIVTTDYEGTMRVFLRRACFDAVCHASGPRGFDDDDNDNDVKNVTGDHTD
uniref:Uncharacterized protein n=1 Tax=Chaetoceros debilis TaxID=122233 RepID=A0A6S8WVD0_9STRA